MEAVCRPVARRVQSRACTSVLILLNLHLKCILVLDKPGVLFLKLPLFFRLINVFTKVSSKSINFYYVYNIHGTQSIGDIRRY